MDPKEIRPRGDVRDETRRPRDPAQTGETSDEDSMAEGMSAASSPSTYAGTPSVSTQRGAGIASRTADEQRILGGTEAYWDNEGPGPRIMAADTLEGDDVMNSKGESLGEIKHIMIDVPSGRVAYAVLSFGGFLGMGDKLFAIPWQALQLDPANHGFILDVDKERLRAAPGFDKEHWPSMADQRWAVELHEYYSSRPYWE